MNVSESERALDRQAHTHMHTVMTRLYIICIKCDLHKRGAEMKKKETEKESKKAERHWRS